jgi:hypothetical protein
MLHVWWNYQTSQDIQRILIKPEKVITCNVGQDEYTDSFTNNFKTEGVDTSIGSG